MSRARPAFTLVELLVATMLVEVGLLALVASSAVVVRQASDGHVHSTAVRAAHNRIETLSARLPCTNSTGHALGPHAIREDWIVRLIGSAEREIVDSVQYAQSTGTKTVVLRTRTPC